MTNNDFFRSTEYRSANERANRDLGREPHKKLMVRVLVYEVDSDEAIRDRVLDFNDHNMRYWVTKTVVWATLNHKSIEIINVLDDK
jgi:hypothetical protein